ncbi:hypothetical protein [Lysobacter gummosus]|uniref:hypothetical protein n=1 Tax=Lysobacter gummosus TaxID=262324 RepID=UPI0036282E5E
MFRRRRPGDRPAFSFPGGPFRSVRRELRNRSLCPPQLRFRGSSRPIPSQAARFW